MENKKCPRRHRLLSEIKEDFCRHGTYTKFSKNPSDQDTGFIADETVLKMKKNDGKKQPTSTSAGYKTMEISGKETNKINPPNTENSTLSKRLLEKRMKRRLSRKRKKLQFKNSNCTCKEKHTSNVENAPSKIHKTVNANETNTETVSETRLKEMKGKNKQQNSAVEGLTNIDDLQNHHGQSIPNISHLYLDKSSEEKITIESNSSNTEAIPKTTKGKKAKRNKRSQEISKKKQKKKLEVEEESTSEFIPTDGFHSHPFENDSMTAQDQLAKYNELYNSVYSAQLTYWENVVESFIAILKEEDLPN